MVTSAFGLSDGNYIDTTKLIKTIRERNDELWQIIAAAR
jgi:hypothetical protein